MTAVEPCPRSQGVFRTLLHAMAHPGQVSALPPLRGGAPLEAVAECLCDHEVRLAVAPVGPDAVELAERLFSLTKSPSAPVEAADYVVVPSGDSDGAALAAKRGDPLFPDRGATLIYCPDAPACNAPPAPVRLSGPGVQSECAPQLGGLSEAEYGRLRTANDDFPLGVDALVLAPDGRVMAIPRSTRIGTR